jgi:hypothetical protein
MSYENTDSERGEDLEEMMEEYDGPSVAEYAQEKDKKSVTHASNSLNPRRR